MSDATVVLFGLTVIWLLGQAWFAARVVHEALRYEDPFKRRVGVYMGIAVIAGSVFTMLTLEMLRRAIP